MSIRGILVKNFGGIETLKLDNKIQLPSLNKNQVLIRMKYSGINPVDTYIRCGTYANLPTLPYIPGKDGAGIVENIGEYVSKFKVGDRVFCCCRGSRFGTLAQQTVVDEADTFNLSDKLSFIEGAALGVPYLTAHRALFHKGNAKKGEHLLVHGASGAVGLAAVQIAKAYGLKVTGTAGTNAGMELVKSCGATNVYNHMDQNYLQQMESDNNKFDLIIEMLANVNLMNDLTLCNSRGRVIIVGSRGDINFSPRLTMGPELVITGCSLFASTQEEWSNSGSTVLKGIEEGWLLPKIDKVYSMDNVATAHHDIINSKGALGKLLVKIDE